MIFNVTGADKATTTRMNREFDYRILIGTQARPAVLRPAKNAANFDGIVQKYTGNWKVGRTFLYVKGFTEARGKMYVRQWQAAVSHRFLDTSPRGMVAACMLRCRRNKQLRDGKADFRLVVEKL